MALVLVVGYADLTEHQEMLPLLLFTSTDYKELATHSSILAWKIPWAEEPVRLQSMGSQE